VAKGTFTGRLFTTKALTKQRVFPILLLGLLDGALELVETLVLANNANDH